MARTYDQSAKDDFVRLFANAIEAVRNGVLYDPFSMGRLIYQIRLLVAFHEEIDVNGPSHDELIATLDDATSEDDAGFETIDQALLDGIG